MTDATHSSALWAKSSDKGGHPLRHHMLDVAAVAYAVQQSLPRAAIKRITVALGLSDLEDTQRWVSAFVGLHDLGKATPGFQAKWTQGKIRAAEAGFDFPVAAPDRHDAATLPLLRDALIARGIRRKSASLLSKAVAAHHGFPIPATESDPFETIDADFSPAWQTAQRDLVDIVLQATGPSGRPEIEQSSAGMLWQWLAGLCAFCDWVGSSEQFFPHGRPFGDTCSAFAEAVMLAHEALARIGWLRPEPPEIIGDERLSVALPEGTAARPLQRAVHELLIDIRQQFLLILEASMGEGKTEAAFIADAASAGTHRSRGVYFALPTQATSNALLNRVAKYLNRRDRGQGSTIQLVHGGTRIEDTQWRLREIGFGDADTSVQTSVWFGGSRKGLLSPNAIGTVDQALVGVLNAKHAFVRLFGLAERLIVLDEVHAYDDYTGTLLERLVAWLSCMGCSVVVMSATLPNAKRHALASAFGCHESLPSLAYPRAYAITKDRVQARTFLPARCYAVDIRAAPETPEQLATLAISLSSDGGCVLIVANTVDRSQAIFRSLLEAGATELTLFHARFPMDERLNIERQLIAQFGPNGARPTCAIVVATQVAEQSLDVDFDVLISDLAPADLLLQRAGRMHRHQRKRPEQHRLPVLHVAGLGNTGIPPRAPWIVYDDWPVLRTAAWLRANPRLELPEAIDTLVQAVYGDGEIPAETILQEAILAARTHYESERRKQKQLAAHCSLDPPEYWIGDPMTVPVDDEAAIVSGGAGGTRLGQQSLTLVPVFDLGDCWSTDGTRGQAWQKSTVIPSEIASALSLRYLRVSNRRAIAAVRACDFPEGWHSSRSLVGTRPLILDSENRLRSDDIAIRLDRTLGLIYEHTK